MKVYNAEKTKELTVYDLAKGRLYDDKIVIETIPAQPEVTEQSHEEIIAEYPNGGKDVKIVIDVPYRPAEPERDVYEKILVYIPYTPKELNDIKHANLKAELKKVKEDIEQETFGLVRDDYAAKKARAAEIINELRVLEGKAPRALREEIE